MRLSFCIETCMARYGRAFLSFVAGPAPCVICGEPSHAVPLCRSCRRSLDEEAHAAVRNPNRCSVCGRPLLSEQGACTACRKTDDAHGTGNVLAPLDRVFPLFPYLLEKKKLLYSWKIAGHHGLSEVFAGYLADVLNTHFPGTVIVPVPPRPGKLRKKGWDQVDDLSRWLENRYGLPVLRALRRTDSVQQKKLTKEERLTHSTRSYQLHPRFRNVRLAEGCRLPSRVVLLDDVLTTGSTLRACADLLLEAGVESVSAVSICIVP